jgi:hypothetical protein
LPSLGIVGIEPDDLIEALSGFVVLALFTESFAFIVPGSGKFRI